MAVRRQTLAALQFRGCTDQSQGSFVRERDSSSRTASDRTPSHRKDAMPYVSSNIHSSRLLRVPVAAEGLFGRNDRHPCRFGNGRAEGGGNGLRGEAGVDPANFIPSRLMRYSLFREPKAKEKCPWPQLPSVYSPKSQISPRRKQR